MEKFLSKIKKHKKIVIFSLIGLLMLLGVSYAFLQLTLRGKKDLSIVVSDTLLLELDDSMEGGIEFSSALPMPDEEGKNLESYTFTLENIGTIKSDYTVYLDDLELDGDQQRIEDQYLKYYLLKDGKEIGFDLLNTTGQDPERVLDTGRIAPGKKYTYELKIWIDYDADSSIMGKAFKGQIRVEATQQAPIVYGNLYEKIKDSSVGTDESIDFTSTTIDAGVYTKHETVSDDYPVYYYRGAVDNHVIFADLCWRIVRTTETGGVKLIYDGSPAEGKCNNTGEESTIGKSAFNVYENDPKYLGYTYEEDGQQVDSTIKAKIDAWYQTAIDKKGYTKYLEDTVWCNDRSGYFAGGGETMFYEAYDRLVLLLGPTLNCKQEADKFTVEEINGNGLLTYPVSLLTADEVMLAGNNESSYLNIGETSHWTLSPYIFEFIDSSGTVFTTYSYGLDSDRVVDSSNNTVRPSVSLKVGMKISSGDGTSDDPFLVDIST